MGSDFFGDRLRLARLFHGKSFQDLGDVVGTSRQYIQQLENGSSMPGAGMMDKLSGALKITPGFFAVANSSMIPGEQCHFRKRKTMPVNVCRQALAHGTMFNDLAEYLDSEIDLPKVDFPQIEKIESPNDIEKAAERCRNHWGLRINAPIVNMVRVLEVAGALVTYFTDISEKIDAFSMHKKRPLVIRNPHKKSTCRMRFDLAHECGHIVMHEGVETGDNRTESQAHRFASAFLLPRTAFLDEFGFLAHSLDSSRLYKLKLRWKVSIAAIARRAYDLEVIDAEKYVSVNIYLRRTGQAKQEKGDDKIDPENLETIKDAFNVLKKGRPESLPGVLEHLHIKFESLKKLVGNVELSQEDFVHRKPEGNVLKFKVGESAQSQ